MTPARAAREQAKNDAVQAKVNGELKDRFEVSCGEGNASGCFSLGEWHAVVGGDLPRAAELYATNCDTRDHADSCYNLAFMLQKGRGVERSPESALRRFVRACELGNRNACFTAGVMTVGAADASIGTPDSSRGVTFLEAGCKKEHWGACAHLGALLLTGHRGVTRDPVAGVRYLSTACDRGEASACRNLSVAYHRGEGSIVADVEKARAYAARALELAAAARGASLVAADK